MLRLSAGVASCFLTIVLMTGCAASVGAPAAKSTVEPTTAPTVAPTTDPTEMPLNRFGLDCASLVSEADIAAVYGEPLALNLNNYFRPHATEALIADGALVCFWGDGGYIGGGAPFLEILAGPSDGVLAEGSAANQKVTCSGGQHLGRCVWNLLTDKVWVSVAFHHFLDNQFDSIESGPFTYDVMPRPGSDSELLVSRISDQLATGPYKPVPASRGSLSPCDAIVDWSAIADELGLSQYSAATIEKWDLAWFKEFGIDPADRQSVRECSASFRDPSDVDQVHVTSISLTAVPGGEWVEHSGLRAGWAGEECTGWEGVRTCDLSVMVGSTAVIVSVDRVAPEVPDGIGAFVVEAFVG